MKSLEESYEEALRERNEAWAAIKRVRAVEREPWGSHLADTDDFWGGWRDAVDKALEALDDAPR